MICKKYMLLLVVLITIFTFYFFVNNSPKTNVFVITIETLRYDHLTCYGYERNTSPNICELAEDGVLFENTFAQGSSTPMSVPPFLTSLHSSVGFNDWDKKFPEGYTTAQDLFNKIGYDTHSFSCEKIISSEIPLGFDNKFVTAGEKGQYGGYDEPYFYQDYRDLFDNGENFFWIFYRQQAHNPYMPDPEIMGTWSDKELVNDNELTMEEWRPPPTLGFNETKIEWEPVETYGLQEVINLYDEEILQVDKRIGSFIDYLKRNNLYDDSIIVITSDHGTGFAERNFFDFHDDPPMKEVSRERTDVPVYGIGRGLPYDEQIKIPMIMKLPQSEFGDREVKQQVRQIDLFPTIFDYLGVDYNSLGTDKDTEHSGKSLMPILENDIDMGLSVFSAAQYNERSWVLVDGEYRLFIAKLANCFNENKDLGILMKDDKIVQNDTLKNEMNKELCDIYKEAAEISYEPERWEIPDEMREDLKNLGYLTN